MKSINLIKIKKYKKLLYKIRDSIKYNYDECFKWYEILLKLGIKSDAHVGSTKLKYNSRKAKLRKIEWYLGQFVNAMDHKSVMTMMALENCFDKFVNDVKYIKPKLGIFNG